jgi:hypothetical protein
MEAPKEISLVKTVNSIVPLIVQKLPNIEKQNNFFMIPLPEIMYCAHNLEDPEEPDEPDDLDDPFYIFKQDIISLNETIGEL